jgi:hypothetical protein
MFAGATTGNKDRVMGKVTVTLCCILVIAASTHASANVGVFYGSGATIELIKSDQVQLVSEEVTISPTCAATRAFDKVECRCKFVLKNLSKKSAKVHVGFPLDYEGHGESAARDATDMVMSYHFIARDADSTYHVQHVAGGGDDEKYRELFLWDMTFAPKEVKTLHVGYVISMSQTGAVTLKDQKSLVLRPEKPWHAMLEGCFLEHFNYITETGRSWAGPIEKATFRVEAGPFEWFLSRRSLDEGSTVASFATMIAAQSELVAEQAAHPNAKPSPELMEKITAGLPNVKLAAAFYREISPKGWKEQSDQGTLTWEFRNFTPGPPVRLRYYFVTFPDDVASCDRWVRLVLGDKPARADLMELREIAAAFYGVAPHTESAKRFVKQQIWYDANSGLRESQLNQKRQAILKHLDEMAK